MSSLSSSLLKSPLVLLILVLGVFGCSVFFPFIALDDAKHIWQNPYVMSLSWENIKFFWSAPYYGLYVPVIYSTWSVLAAITEALNIKHEISGIGGSLFHVLCVATHILNVWMVWKFFEFLSATFDQSTKSRHWIVFATAVFAIHPLQAEAVAWASGLKDTLSAAFILLALLSFCGAIQFSALKSSTVKGKNKSLEALKLPLFFYRHSSLKFLIFATLALATKPIAVVLPAVLFAFVFIFDRAKIKKSLKLILPVVVIAFIVMWMTKGAQPSDRLEFVIENWQRPLVALGSLGFYIFKFLAPYPLAPDYGLTPPQLLQSSLIYLYFAIAAVYILGLLFSFRVKSERGPYLRLGLLTIGLGFGPVLGFVPFEFQNLSTVADRYFYLFPAIGVGLVFIGLTNSLEEKYKTAFTTAFSVIMLGWAALSTVQTTLWASNERLFLHTVGVNPNSYLSYNNLGLQSLRNLDYDNAAKYFNEALKAKSDYLAAIANLGVVYFKRQDFAGTIQYYKTKLEQLPKAGPGSPATYADMYFNLGAAYLNVQQFNLGVESLKTAVTVNPDHFMAHYHLGRAYVAQGSKELAKQELMQALRLQPGDARVLAELQKIK